jgi:CRP-like cAMP-binding protein
MRRSQVAPGGGAGRSELEMKVTSTHMQPQRAMSVNTSNRPQFILLPDSRFRVIWDAGGMLLLGWISIVTPFVISMDVHPSAEVMVFDRFIDCYFIIDLLLNFRTAYINSASGEPVWDPRMIARQYLKSWFPIDLVASIPFDVILSNTSGRFPRLVRIMRLFRLAKLVKLLKLSDVIIMFEDHLNVNRNVFSVLKLLLLMSFVGHITACAFAMSGDISQQEYGDSWLKDSGLLDEGVSTKYVAALYFSVTVMTTMGFGDITAQTRMEQLVVIFSMFIAAGTYAFVISDMSGLVASMNINKKTYFEKLNKLNAYMESRQLPWELRLRVRRYYRFFLDKRSAVNESEVFSELSSSLRCEVAAANVKTMFADTEFFKDQNQDYISAAAVKMKPMIFMHQEIVLNKGDLVREIFVIGKGQLECFITDPQSNNGAVSNANGDADFSAAMGDEGMALSEEGGRKDGELATASGIFVSQLQAGDYFGHTPLMLEETKGVHQTNVLTLTVCNLYAISVLELCELLVKYQSAMEQLMSSALENHAKVPTYLRAFAC